MITIKNLSKSYGKQKVLKAIDVEFNKGHIIGVVGENGAGKTTLFRCIAGLESYEGEILSDHTKLKDNLGLLLAEPYFFSKITGKEYLNLIVNARQIKLSNLEEHNIFDLPLNKYATSYSTGMKKKLALTAILLQKNDVYILDEPFNGVDIQSNLVITEILNKLRKLERTVIISSHIFSTLADVCDEIILMRNGEIVKSVKQTDFKALEAEIKDFEVGDRVNKLDL